MKWFPETDPLSLDGAITPWGKRDSTSPPRSPARWWVIRHVYRLERGDNSYDILPLLPKPWPLLPLRPRSQLEPGVEEWGRPRILMLDGHIESWANNTRTIPSGLPAVLLPRLLNGNDCEQMQPVQNHHLALCIPELLQGMLGLLDPRSQFVARNVCYEWRTALAEILRLKFRSHDPCEPIEYLQPIISDVPGSRPSTREMDAMREEVTHLLALPRSRYRPGNMRSCYIYFPARIHQAIALDKSTSDLFRSLHSTEPLSQYLPKVPSSPCWLDLTQVVFNPYFTELFSGRLTFHHGYCSLELIPDLDNLTTSPAVLSEELYQLISPMYATQPPCKALGVYLDYGFVRIGLATNEKGVTIQDLLDPLRNCAPETIAVWCIVLSSTRQRITEKYWTHYTFATERMAIWGTVLIPHSGPR